jgi:uncharacterized protein
MNSGSTLYYRGLQYKQANYRIILWVRLRLRLMLRIFGALILGLCTQLLCAQNELGARLASASVELTQQRVTYDPAYFSIPYPNGDVPADKGVCTDVIIRAYRKLGVDLQQLVHEDMKSNFPKYPNNWGLTKTDRNIDHRRVPNLMVFFKRHGTELSISQKPEDYNPGDIVCWMLPGNLTHIGIVSNKRNKADNRWLIVHNIGAGQVMEDCLFSYEIIGHYRYQK